MTTEQDGGSMKMALDLPIPSTDAVRAAVSRHEAGNLYLRVEMVVDDEDRDFTVVFIGVRAIRWTTEGLCSVWHVRDASLKVSEVHDSSWLADLAKGEGTDRRLGGYHHFAVFLYDGGATEVIAHSVGMA
jgi:hypothetical protein